MISFIYMFLNTFLYLFKAVFNGFIFYFLPNRHFKVYDRLDNAPSYNVNDDTDIMMDQSLDQYNLIQEVRTNSQNEENLRK